MSAIAVVRTQPRQNTSLGNQRRERHLQLVDSPLPGRRIFRWDASSDLTALALARHRERFPRHTGASPQKCDLPAPEQWAANLCLGLAEIMYGYRPITQLQRWVLPELFRALAAALDTMPLHKPLQRGVRVVAARVCPFSERICETCVILEACGYRRIISVRLEGHNGYWIATALEVI